MENIVNFTYDCTANMSVHYFLLIYSVFKEKHPNHAKKLYKWSVAILVKL